MSHPSHIDGYVVDASFCFKAHTSANSFYYQVKCKCGCVLFSVEISDKPKALAKCSHCGFVIPVYDVSFYPCATPKNGEAKILEIDGLQGQNHLKVFVMYEYGETDPDEIFNRDDISWCQVFVEDQNQNKIKILDDETA